MPPYAVREYADEWAPASSLIPSPSKAERQNARRALLAQCAAPEAYDAQYWFSHRAASVAAQTVIRDSLNVEAAWHISRWAAKSAADLHPCKRTVVSIATIPSRIGRLYPLIESIRAQSLPPDQILIALPPFAPRMKQTYTVRRRRRREWGARSGAASAR